MQCFICGPHLLDLVHHSHPANAATGALSSVLHHFLILCIVAGRLG